jgi:hypothetical protein
MRPVLILQPAFLSTTSTKKPRIGSCATMHRVQADSCRYCQCHQWHVVARAVQLWARDHSRAPKAKLHGYTLCSPQNHVCHNICLLQGEWAIASTAYTQRPTAASILASARINHRSQSPSITTLVVQSGTYELCERERVRVQVCVSWLASCLVRSGVGMLWSV